MKLNLPLCAFALAAAAFSLTISLAGEGPPRGGGGRGGDGPPGGGEQRPDPGTMFIKYILQHATDLNLTADQKAKLEQMMKQGPMSVLNETQKRKLMELGPPPRPDEAGGGQGSGGRGDRGGGGGERRGPPEGGGGERRGPPEGAGGGERRGPPEGADGPPQGGEGGGDRPQRRRPERTDNNTNGQPKEGDGDKPKRERKPQDE